MSVRYVNYKQRPKYTSDLTAFYAGTEKPLPPGYISGPIIRDCYILEYVHTGKGKVEINSNAFDVKTGQAFVTFPGAVTTMTTDEKEPWGKSWVCLQGERVRYFLNLLGINEEHPIFPWRNKKEILNHIHDTIDRIRPRGEEDELNRNICGNELFKLLLKFNNDKEVKFTLEQKQSVYITRALQFIEYNYGRSITASSVAEHVGLNRTYFSTLFKEKLKVTPHQYLIDYKIKKACEFFKNPNASVASVGASVGYEPQVFSRLFKAQTGLTPMQYIKKIKG